MWMNHFNVLCNVSIYFVVSCEGKHLSININAYGGPRTIAKSKATNALAGLLNGLLWTSQAFGNLATELKQHSKGTIRLYCTLDVPNQ